jgi:Nif-specific regulatory protein
MDSAVSAYLVLKRPDGYGEVHPLTNGQRYTVGRAAGNRIVLADDMCSRNHAELFRGSNGWTLQDLSSLNGCFVNGDRITGMRGVRPGDELRFGRTDFAFVLSLNDLPAPHSPTQTTVSEELRITKRANRTRFLPPRPTDAPPDQTIAAHPAARPVSRLSQSEAVGVLYRLAVDMAAATTPTDLAELVIEAAFQGTPAEVAAVLAVKEGGDLDTVSHRFRHGGQLTYHKVSTFVSREVLSSKQAVIAENVAADKSLRNRDSLTELKATSLVCAPVVGGDRVLGLLHLYCTGEVGLNADDLEFALAAARQLGVVWDRHRNRDSLTVENQSLKAQLRLESELVGASPQLRQIEQQVAKVAGTKATVLIRGESGVGKELVARAIHMSSPRKDRPFICLNCAAITETLLESELFGHEKGAFTGATERMIGKFESADTGTLFLDEIGEMTAGAQVKLLRVLEGQSFERVGGNVPIKVDVRVVAATNRPLEVAVRANRFRTDLYYRLQVVQIDVPPLRDRPADVSKIADYFLKKFAREMARKITGFTPEAAAKLAAHNWPGNVRELRNAVERAVALAAGPLLDEADIWLSPLEVGGGGPERYEPLTLDEIEKRHILRTLKHTGWNKSKTAKILGIERSTLDRKINAYDLKK